MPSDSGGGSSGGGGNWNRASEMRCQRLQPTILICDSFVRVCLFHCDKRRQVRAGN